MPRHSSLILLSVDDSADHQLDLEPLHIRQTKLSHTAATGVWPERDVNQLCG